MSRSICRATCKYSDAFFIFHLFCPFFSQWSAVFTSFHICWLHFCKCIHSICIIVISFYNIYNCHRHAKCISCIGFALIFIIFPDASILNIVITHFCKFRLIHILANCNCSKLFCNFCSFDCFFCTSHRSKNNNCIFTYTFWCCIYKFTACNLLRMYSCRFAIHKVLCCIMSIMRSSSCNPYNTLKTSV